MDQIMEQVLQTQGFMVNLAINAVTGIKESLIKGLIIKGMQLEHLIHHNQSMSVVVVPLTICSLKEYQ